jgi:hypothetical protein
MADLRRAGFGARLLTTAEVEAARRGCREMHLDTHSYQVPDFYRHRGYEVVGELPGWPDHTTRIFFRKTLSNCLCAVAAAAAPLASLRAPEASEETERRSHDASRSILDDGQAR